MNIHPANQSRFEECIFAELTDTYVLPDGTQVQGQAVSFVLAAVRRAGWVVPGTLYEFETWVEDHATVVTLVRCRPLVGHTQKPGAPCKAVVLR